MDNNNKRAEMFKELLEEYRINRDKLESCPLHQFEEDATIIDRTPRYTCTRCGGTVLYEAKRWYEKGLEHGRDKVD